MLSAGRRVEGGGRVEGMPVDSHLDILNGVTAVERPHGVSLGGAKQDCASAQRPLKGLQSPHGGWQMTLVASPSSYKSHNLTDARWQRICCNMHDANDNSFWHTDRLISCKHDFCTNVLFALN